MIKGRIGYLMSRFPHLPETFILREMTELKRQGWEVALYPLIRQEQEVVHEQAREWLRAARFTPIISRELVMANLSALGKRPADLSAIWLEAARGNAGNWRFLARAAALLPMSVLIAEKMQREGVVHVHAHYATHPALVAWSIQRLTGIPYSITVHAHDIFVSRAMLEKKIGEAAFIVSISEYNRDYLSQTVGKWVREKTHVVHCGVDPSLYAHRGERGAQGERFEILNIGSLQPYKGQSYLVEACAILKQKSVPFFCRIIGAGNQQGLKQIIARHGLGDQVELLGPLDEAEVARSLKQAACYVQPSIVTPSGKMEGIPVSLMEAMAAETPVVATCISGVPELVQDRRTGYLVPPADALALADAIEAVYRRPQEAKALAATGRRLVIKEFNLHTNVGQLGALFQGHFEARSQVAEQIFYAAHPM